VLAGYAALRGEISGGRRQRIAFLPLVGLLVIGGDVFYNLVIQHSRQFLGLDWMTLLFGLILIFYNSIPARYDAEARFITIFLGLFFITLSLPLALLTLEFGGKAASFYTEVFIAKPIAAMLNAVGIPTTSVSNWVYYTGKYENIQMGMGISCSGVYSLAIFFSAFVAYVHVKYKAFNARMAALLVLGLAGGHWILVREERLDCRPPEPRLARVHAVGLRLLVCWIRRCLGRKEATDCFQGG